MIDFDLDTLFIEKTIDYFTVAEEFFLDKEFSLAISIYEKAIAYCFATRIWGHL